MRKAELSKRVMRTLAIAHGETHVFRDRSGNAPIVISMPNDHVGDIFARARNVTSDGGVNVVIAYAKNFEVLAFDGRLQADADIEISPDTSMGMMSLKASQNPGKVIRVVFRDSESVDIPSLSSIAYA